ncbi:TadE/TadG family type IV pilus assembly protein [Actinomyces howellii]|uniref:TadE-like protein n=1 Tax=Actinomyces howellii TaxID=52771 RepID=A0A448HI25_9ACTO|nr:TadE/TadG family type IV pilus assembly protein [Actinomyces howellii]VEG28984.1 TadE-like protein [Actinomyces howellii]
MRSLAGRLRARQETGASSVELLVFFPLLLLIVLITIQVALSWYGNEVAMSTAREVAREVRGGGSPSAAEADGITYARQVGVKALTDVDVDVVVTGQEVTVTVSGESMDIVAGLAPRVSASVTSELETFREDT